MAERELLPAEEQDQERAAAHIVIAPYYRDPENGAVYVHEALKQTIPAYQDQDRTRAYVAPPHLTERFGDVASWAAYVRRFGRPETAFLGWNTAGLEAILDYHAADAERTPGRLQWRAAHAFTIARELAAWQKIASGAAIAQAAFIEHLETLADTIINPGAADLIGIISTLRATVTAETKTEIRPNGTAKIEAVKDGKVIAAGERPAHILIRVAVLAGHMDDDGNTVRYDLDVRLRVTPTEKGADFRLAIPKLAATLEDAYADRVAAAAALLGDDFPILRVADK
jgi:hypothetical protein